MPASYGTEWLAVEYGPPRLCGRPVRLAGRVAGWYFPLTLFPAKRHDVLSVPEDFFTRSPSLQQVRGTARAQTFNSSGRLQAPAKALSVEWPRLVGVLRSKSPASFRQYVCPHVRDDAPGKRFFRRVWPLSSRDRPVAAALAFSPPQDERRIRQSADFLEKDGTTFRAVHY